MKNIILILILLFSIQSVYAYQGAVINSSDFVQYKFDIATLPKLLEGEYIVLTSDINNIQKDAKYKDGIFINPEPIIYEEITLEVKRDPFNPTQTIISGLTGAGTAYFMVRRLKTKGA